MNIVGYIRQIDASVKHAIATRAIMADLRAGIGQKSMDGIIGGDASVMSATET